MNNRLARFTVILPYFFIMIPLILILISGEIRPSISNYVYNVVALPFFSSSLSMAAMVYIYEGVGKENSWYYTIVGVALLGVIYTPHHDYPIIHYTFATIVF